MKRAPPSSAAWVVRQKPFLRKIYQEWYAELLKELPTCRRRVLEIGAGAGFLEKICTEVIRSDILPCRHLRGVVEGEAVTSAKGPSLY